MEMDAEASRDAPRRKVFYRSLLLFILWTQRRRERLANWHAWHAFGFRTVTSFVAGVPL